jgi:predicted Zn-dependent protease
MTTIGGMRISQINKIININMKNYTANVFIYKDKNVERKNFTIKSDSDSEEVLKSLIIEKININKEKFEFVNDWFELVVKESVVIYETEWKKIKSVKEVK